MTRLTASLFALLLATAAHAQSGLLPANQVWAGPPSGGQAFAKARALVAADLPPVPAGSLSLASGQILVGQVSGFAGAVTMSGDCTIVASGAIVCTKTNAVAFGALATATPGTGVATALGTAVGSAGSVVVNGGALGTPSSGVGTNLTALNASNLGSGTVPAARGGAGTVTGALKGNGAGLVTQAACADLSGVAASCSTDATVASNITSGTLPPARLGGLSSITNSLSSPVTMTVQSTVYDGPSVAQGSTGTWFASGNTSLSSGTNNILVCKLWDGTTVIDSGVAVPVLSGTVVTIHLSGALATPAGNLRISCLNASAAGGTIASTNGIDAKASTITAFRIN